MVEAFGVDLSGLVLDMTNFATYIDSAQRSGPDRPAGPRQAETKRPAHSSASAWWSPPTAAIPLVSHAYPGNRPDVTQFGRWCRRARGPLWHPGATARASSPWSSTPARTPQDNSSCSRARRCISSARCRPSDHPELLAVGRAATGPSTGPLPRAERLRDHEGRLRHRSAASSSPTPRACTTSSPEASTRPWPRPAASSASSRPAWPGARPASPAKRSRPRSPRSSSPGGCPG